MEFSCTELPLCEEPGCRLIRLCGLRARWPRKFWISRSLARKPAGNRQGGFRARIWRR